MNAVANEATRSWSGIDKLGDIATGVGIKLSAGITVPLVGASMAALKVAGDFEETMAKVSAMGEISGASLEKLRQQALDLGAQTKFSAQQAADAMAVFASAGYDAEKIYAVMPGTLDLAAAGQISVAEAATFTADVLGQFGLAAGDAGHMADIMARALMDTKFTMTELGATLSYVGPTARSAGMSLEETVAAIVALDEAGLRGEKAGTGLRGVIASLTSPSKKAAGAMAELGIEIGNTDGTIRPLPEILDQFKVGLARMGTDVERQAALQKIFGRESGTAARVLIEQGGPALAKYAEGLHNVDGTSRKLADQLNKGLKASWEQLGGAVETAAITLGTILIPTAKKALESGTDLINRFVTPAVKWFGELPDPVKNAALAITALVAAAGPMLLVAGQLARSISDIGKATTTLTGHLDKFPALASIVRTSLNGIGVAVLAVGTAFAGWQLGKWLYEQHIPAVDALAYSVSAVLLKFEMWRKFIAWVQGDLPEANEQIANLENILKELGITVERGSRSQDEYAKFLHKTIDEVTDKGNAEKIHALQVKAGTDAASKKAAADKAAREELERLSNSLGLGTANQKKHSEETFKSTTAMEAYEIALRQVRQKISELEEAERRGYEVAAELAALRKSEGILYAGLHPGLVKHKEATVDIVAETEKLAKAVGDLGPQIQTVEIDFGALADGMKNLPVPQTVQAFQHLGMKSVEELQRMADASQRAFEILSSSGVAGAGQVRQAHIAALEDIVAVYRAKGEEVPLAQQIMLAKLTQQQRDYQENAVYGWATLWQSLRDNMSDMFATLNRTVFTGDWEGMKNRVINDLQNMGAAVLDKFLKPAQDAISNFIATSLTDLLGGNGFGGLGSMLGGIGSAVGKLFGGGGGGGGNAVGDAAFDSIPLISGLGSALHIPGLSNIAGSATSAITGIAGGASGALSGIMGSLTSVLNPIGMIGSIVGGVGSILQAFGVGSQGEKDRLNIIANNTSYLAWAFSTGGLHEAILKTKEALIYSIAPNLEWILTHASIQVGLLEPMRWDISAIRHSLETPDRSVAAPPISIVINGYNQDPQALADEVVRRVSNALAFQGV